MMTLGGYWVTLDALRKLTEKLHMELGEHTSPWTNPNIKAGGIDWSPKSKRFGVIFISKFARQDYHVPLEEDAGDLVVKEWLRREGDIYTCDTTPQGKHWEVAFV
ncbi:hypothetical protein FIBSPDRAFT_861245 [Athelia psychrophila]|uniref:Uncharacterized protein n=1 Tax=Athelia psychrophila TaxID=1759441 RepID=A0A166JFM8_9AGAM|nr:hypothetical protein FIBSPDRAFT_861245 [Fibularhizoctonia sp. CBS 109695]